MSKYWTSASGAIRASPYGSVATTRTPPDGNWTQSSSFPDGVAAQEQLSLVGRRCGRHPRRLECAVPVDKHIAVEAARPPASTTHHAIASPRDADDPRLNYSDVPITPVRVFDEAWMP